MSEEKIQYNYVEQTDLESMSPEEVMGQYHSLIDWLKQEKGWRVERNPKMDNSELIDTIMDIQHNHADDILRLATITALEQWERDHPGKPLLYSGGTYHPPNITTS